MQEPGRSPSGPTRTVAIVSLVGLAAAWGTIPLIVRGVDLPGEQLAALRLALGAVVLVAILGLRGELGRVPRGLRGRVIVLGVLLAVHWASFFLSIKWTAVAVALVLVYLAPVVQTALAPWLLGEPFIPRTAVALALSLGGTVLVVAVGNPGGEVTARGIVAGLIAAATFAALVLVGKPAAAQLGGLRLAGHQFPVAALVLAPWGWQALPEAGAFVWQLLILGVVLTGIAGVVYWRSVAVLPVATVGVVTYVEPVSAVVWAALFLGERPDLVAWLGVASVAAGGVLVARDRPVVPAEEPIWGQP